MKDLNNDQREQIDKASKLITECLKLNKIDTNIGLSAMTIIKILTLCISIKDRKHLLLLLEEQKNSDIALYDSLINSPSMQETREAYQKRGAS